MIRINCDIGERGMDNPVDLALIEHIDIANIACGGHAGDGETVRVFMDLAGEKGVAVSAHLSYPDREHFGRISMTLPMDELSGALDDQLALMPGVALVKFHGGLYNDSCGNPELADHLAEWLARHQIRCILAPSQSLMARAARSKGIEILAEAFAERRYQFWPETNTLALLRRSHDKASIDDCDDAVHHATGMVRHGKVSALVEAADGIALWENVDIRCDTLCVHSDSAISLDLARRLADLNRNGWRTHV